MIRGVYVWGAFALLLCSSTSTRADGQDQIRLSGVAVDLIRQVVLQDSNNNTTSHQPRTNALVLIPASTNVSDLAESGANFHLFKLNIDQLADERSPWESTSLDQPEERTSGGMSLAPKSRQSRRLNWFKFNKNKVSPLYLVNGAVCRFVNSMPICTNLSQINVIRGPNTMQGGMQGGFGGGSNMNTIRQPGQSSQSSVQFANQPRPAALLDEDTPGINVESLGTTRSPLVFGQQPTLTPITSALHQSAIPVSYVVNRRPLGLFSLRRPVRHYQIINAAPG